MAFDAHVELCTFEGAVQIMVTVADVADVHQLLRDAGFSAGDIEEFDDGAVTCDIVRTSRFRVMLVESPSAGLGP